jgi:hypothetical protein
MAILLILNETGCPGCIHVWKNWPLLFDTTNYVLSSGGFDYAVKVIGECESISEGINLLSTLPSHYIKKLDISTATEGSIRSITKSDNGTLAALGMLHQDEYDFYLACFKDDQLIWHKEYGGSQADYPIFLINPPGTNRYYFGGLTESSDGDVSYNHGSHDGWIIKADSSGNIINEKAFGGTSYDAIYSLEQVSPNRFVAAGGATSNNGDLTSTYGNGDVWVMMLDSNLNIIWSKNYGGTESDWPFQVSVINKNRIAVYAETWSNDIDIPENKGSKDVWLFMIDSTGEIIWSKTLGTSEYESSRLGSLLTDHNSIFISVTAGGGDGDFPSSYGSTNTWLIKLDTLGNEAWKISLSGSLSDDNSIISFDEDSNIIMVMQSSSNDGLIAMPTDFFSWSYAIFKIDDIGNILSKKFIQGDSYFYDQQSDIWVFDIDTDQENTLIVSGAKFLNAISSFWIEYINLSDPQIIVTAGSSPSCTGEEVILSTETCDGCSILWSNGTTTQQNSVTAPGDYAVTVSFALPCYSFTDTISISYYPEAVPPLITQQNDTLFSSYSTNNQWYINAVAIMGATESFIPITAFGCYQVAYTDSFGCTVFSDTLCVFGTQIQNIQQPLLNVYPNPFESVINIKGIGWEGITQIQMKDVLGRILKSETLQNNNLPFSLNWNLQQLPAGIYFIEAKGKQATNTIRLVKNKAGW